MNLSLEQLQNIRSDFCLTLVLNTYRTRPDNQVDSIALKNLCKQAQERLQSYENTKNIKGLIQRLEDLASTIDHEHNLESLIIYVNEEIAEYTRLTVPVTDRVVIGNTFSIRDLVRAQNQQTGFLVLVLSQQHVRLIEALNDTVVKEFEGSFPKENTQFITTNKAEKSNSTRQSHLIAEFFNRVDKEVNEVRKGNPLPVLICTETGNYYEYLKIADQKETIFEVFLNGNRLNEEPLQIVQEAWEIVKDETIKGLHARKQELMIAVGKGNFLSDINDIYRAIQAGNIQTLFIEEELFQPGKIEERAISLVSEEEGNQMEVSDDIYDELIKSNQHFGGETVFLPMGELSDFDGLGAVTRY